MTERTHTQHAEAHKSAGSIGLSPSSLQLVDLWSALSAPIRPTSVEIAVYARDWSRARPSVLVLGTTPELVDLAVRQHASKIITMEQNESMFAAMRHLANETWDGVETYTWDWREFLPELEGTIDLVLADGSLNMLNFPGEWELALSNVRRYLRVPGRLVCRIACQLRGSFDFDSYLDATLAAFERSSASSSPAERSTCFRQLLSEVRLATAFGALDASGCVDLDQRATLTGRAHSRLAARYANWQTWSRFSIALNTEQGVRQGVNTSKGVPTLRSAARLMEACGLTSIRAETHVVRPARGAMRIVSAERM